MSFFGHNASMQRLSKKCPEKKISADEADVKKQEMKKLVAVSYNFVSIILLDVLLFRQKRAQPQPAQRFKIWFLILKVSNYFLYSKVYI